jgi:glutamate synthase domain-containing protein 2/glutamate synthase domain-containing protein 1/glutamate synthase domain-containing protein 3
MVRTPTGPARHRTHGSCGVAAIAHLSGAPRHDVVSRALQALANLAHRGAEGADVDTGDGAGLLAALPDDLLRAGFDVDLPAPGAYGVAMCFLPRDAIARGAAEQELEHQMASAGMRPLGWRDVPVAAERCGRRANEMAPVIRQLAIAAGEPAGDREAFERALYLARRRAEATLPEASAIVSCSSRTIVYKGMLTAAQLPRYYADLRDERFASPVALVHLRFSTNTLPRWDLAHPFRLLAHNGEINTLQGNRAWMRAREPVLRSSRFGDELADALPVIPHGGSDSAMLDNALELLTLAGRPLPQAVMTLLPEAYDTREDLSPELVDFYRYTACLQEPWDGPAWVSFTDGTTLGAALDRNGLRPGRWVTTDDGWVVLSSEAGVLPIPEGRVTAKGRLRPGKLFVVDVAAGTVSVEGDAEQRIAAARPYGAWVRTHLRELRDLPTSPVPPSYVPVRTTQLAFGWTAEDVDELVVPLARDGQEPNGSMGDDTALAVLNDDAPLLPTYFKQRFAQVTNPAIDPLREDLVMSLEVLLGARGNLLEPGPEAARLVRLTSPVLAPDDLARLWRGDRDVARSEVLDMTWPADAGPGGLDCALRVLAREAERAVHGGATVLVLTDRWTDRTRVPVPALLAVASVHHHLIRTGYRWRAGLVVDAGEPRDVHHLACLLGYGASAVHPRVLWDTIADLADDERLTSLRATETEQHVIAGMDKGLRKIMAKMGISTLSAYCGAQVFEAVGLGAELVDRHFSGTPTQIGGADLLTLGREAVARHARAWPLAHRGPPDHAAEPVDRRTAARAPLPLGGRYRWRRDGERHMWAPDVVASLQRATLYGQPEGFDAFSAAADDAARAATVRGQLDIVVDRAAAVDVAEVEPITAIVARFATGAMSLGSLSPEAHETLAIAMNRVGGRSNTGEGGEDSARWTPDPSGDLRRSAIKQVASARFGVDIAYLTNADELQIKVAQGSKPGEGGQLPGHKVDDHIARLRFATPGVELISPPPHHDIYSIEDLKQLIFDLRAANPNAEVSVKLVAEAGVGTIAAGVAKAGADRVIIAGDSGGTGSSPRSSITSAGLPWELGLAETQQVLMDNDLRGHVRLQVDGQMKTARDVVVAGLLGAEEVAFSTAPLIAAGCVMMRVCHLNTCPVGIATQDPRLRERFAGEPEHVIAYITQLADGVRHWLARLGLRTFDDLVGRVDLLAPSGGRTGKAALLDMTELLHRVGAGPRHRDRPPLVPTAHRVDERLVAGAAAALDGGARVALEDVVTNVDRAVGGRLSHEVARRHGAAGLAEGTIRAHLTGSAGQSFGAWLAAGITLTLEGEANDYVGKGLSGGVLALRPPAGHRYAAAGQIIAGNTCLYGATRGRAFLRGQAGERFAVRNSGAVAVVEGVGDHGCEYMTGGTVVVLGPTGRNFAAGMSGGTAFVLDADRTFEQRCNPAMVRLKAPDDEDLALLADLLAEHRDRTGSDRAADLLAGWDATVAAIVKVMPIEYERVLSQRSGGPAGGAARGDGDAAPSLPPATAGGAAVAEVVRG